MLLSSPRRVLVAITTSVLLASLTLAGCASEAERPAVTHSSSPSAEPEETPTPVPTVAGRPAPDISAYDAMSLADFGTLSSDEQMVYGVGKLAPALANFAAVYYGVSKDALDVLPEGSVDNTAQEIATQVAYNVRFSLSLDPGDGREKFILAILRNDTQSGFYPLIEGLSAKADTVALPAGFIASVNAVSVGSNASMGDLQQDTNHDKFRQITVTGEDGVTGSFNAYFVSIPLPDGTTFATWIRE